MIRSPDALKVPDLVNNASHSGSDYLKFKQETITYTLRKSGASWKDSDAGTSGRILFD